MESVGGAEVQSRMPPVHIGVASENSSAASFPPCEISKHKALAGAPLGVRSACRHDRAWSECFDSTSFFLCAEANRAGWVTPIARE